MENNPQYKVNKFKCPHCSVVAQQKWFNSDSISATIVSIYNHLYLNYRAQITDYNQDAIAKFLQSCMGKIPDQFDNYMPESFSVAICESCDDYSLWVSKNIVYPKTIKIDPPNEDLNEEIKSIYIEASTIFLDSPKGSTALLRLALQMLLKQLGKDGNNINNDIKELVEAGLSAKIQKALDLLRVVGNNAVHPGQINLDDDSEIALKLFKILNIITEEMITKPKEIDELYNDVIPEETRGHIEQRDGGNN